MKNKKLVIIISALIVLAIAAVVYFTTKSQTLPEVIPEKNYTPEEIQLKDKSSEVISKWGNFDDNTTSDYLDSIKPYLSEDVFASEQEASVDQKSFNQQAGQVLKQKYIIKKVELVEHNQEDGDILTYKISATREISGVTSSSTTFIKYEKINDEWKIISIESD